MNERAVAFGPSGGLSGVLCEPEPDVARVGAPTIVTWNVGINHHAGPYRFFVDLARTLAGVGFSSLRFDLSGLGDSAARRDAASSALPEPERALEDVREAMSFLQRRRGPTPLVLVGFCSGVDAAHRVATDDARVEGVCFIEGYAFRTRGFFARYPLRFLDRGRWVRLVSRRMPAPLRSLPGLRDLGRFSGAVSEEDRVFVRDYPPPETLGRDYLAMSERGTRQLHVYAGLDGSYNHERQLLAFTRMRSLPAGMEIAFLPRADHTFFRVADREQVIARIVSWLMLSPTRACTTSGSEHDRGVHETASHGEPTFEP